MRTPPISTAAFASRGKPPLSLPMSLAVPPTSTTIASCAPERNAAPRMLLVGPEAKQCTGKRRASSARAMAPSFRVRYSGAGRPVRRSAPSRAAIVLAGELLQACCDKRGRPQAPPGLKRERASRNGGP